MKTQVARLYKCTVWQLLYGMRGTVAATVRHATYRGGHFFYGMRGTVAAMVWHARYRGAHGTASEVPWWPRYGIRGIVAATVRHARYRGGHCTACKVPWWPRYGIRGTVAATVRHARYRDNGSFNVDDEMLPGHITLYFDDFLNCGVYLTLLLR